MKLRKGMLGALLGVTFATTLLSTSIVHADNNYTSTVGDVAVRTIRDDENMIGWKKINNQWYYLDSAGNYVKGWINVDGKQYYLKADGTRATNTIIGDYIFGNEGVGYQGKNENGKFYFADGWYYNFSDKKVYYPNHTSLKVGDDGKVYVNGRRVTFDSQGVFQSNWFEINRLWYSFNLSGKAVTGWQKIDEYWYYFNEFGTPHNAWLKVNSNIRDYFDKYKDHKYNVVIYVEDPNDNKERTYYFDSETGVMQTGWVTDKYNIKHYFYPDGRMARNTKIGEYTIDEHGGASIKIITGWKKTDDGKWYYYENGEMITGWKLINNNWYYFGLYGHMATGLESPIGFHGGGWYYFNSSGVMQKGWQRYNGEWCYFGSSGNMHMGWQKIDGKWYYFGPSKNMPELVTVNEKGIWYNYNISGAMKTGWQKIDGSWYYFDSSGAMKTGWLDDKGKKYYLQPSGAMATNTMVGEYKIDAAGIATKIVKNGWQSVNNHWYYYTNSKKVTGWKAVNNVWYYFDSSGVMKTGWQKVNGVWYYFNPSGAMQKGWQKIDGAWYYFSTSGAMKTGWLDYAGKKYYFKSTGAMATNTTVGEYKIDAAGIATKIVKNGWQSVNNHWYYYTNGKKVTGWKAVNNVWYYFDSSGVMKTGWQKVNGVWYYFNPSGAMQKGWQKIDGAWYYFSTSGVMKTGWLDYAGQKYYLKSTGAMATNTTVDGYAINAAGVAINKQVKELDDAKTSAIEQLKALNLKDQLNDYTSRIANAKTTDEIVTIVNEAKATSATNDANDKAAKELADAKTSALETLKSFTHIDTTTYVNRVNAVTSTSAIQPIVEEARAAEVKATTPVTPKPVTSNSIVKSEEARHAFIVEFTRLLNDFRKENGLNEIQSTTLLNRAADIRSEDEKDGLITFANTGTAPDDWDHFRPDGSSTGGATSQAALEGYNLDANGAQSNIMMHDWVNENIAINYQTKRDTPEMVAQKVFTQWKNSPGHRRNMLSSRAEVFGIGFWGDPAQSGMYIEFTFIGGQMHNGFTKDDIQLFQ